MNYKPKNQLKVDGKMSTDGADNVGITLAKAAYIFAVMAGLALLITAIGSAFAHFYH